MCPIFYFYQDMAYLTTRLRSFMKLDSGQVDQNIWFRNFSTLFASVNSIMFVWIKMRYLINGLIEAMILFSTYSIFTKIRAKKK
jgi:hypothetical protein